MAEYSYVSHPYKRKANGKKMSILLHRRVWMEHNGEIPEGFIIHHKDGNKWNNEIENLQMITKSEHQLIHRSGSASPQLTNVKSTCLNTSMSSINHGEKGDT